MKSRDQTSVLLSVFEMLQNTQIHYGVPILPALYQDIENSSLAPIKKQLTIPHHLVSARTSNYQCLCHMQEPLGSLYSLYLFFMQIYYALY